MLEAGEYARSGQEGTPPPQISPNRFRTPDGSPNPFLVDTPEQITGSMNPETMSERLDSERRAIADLRAQVKKAEGELGEASQSASFWKHHCDEITAARTALQAELDAFKASALKEAIGDQSIVAELAIAEKDKRALHQALKDMENQLSANSNVKVENDENLKNASFWKSRCDEISSQKAALETEFDRRERSKGDVDGELARLSAQVASFESKEFGLQEASKNMALHDTNPNPNPNWRHLRTWHSMTWRSRYFKRNLTALRTHRKNLGPKLIRTERHGKPNSMMQRWTVSSWIS